MIVKLTTLVAVQWSVPFPVPYHRVRTVCADIRRDGGDCNSYCWWPISWWDYRRLLLSSNI